MTDNDIVKALECCADRNATCHNCVLHNENNLVSDIGNCTRRLKTQALDLINRQKDEIERLEAENKLLIDNDVSNKYPNCVLVEKGRIYTKTLEDYDNLIGDISVEAYKEFAESVKCLMRDRYLQSDMRYSQFATPEDIDNLLKELVGEQRKEDEGK